LTYTADSYNTPNKEPERPVVVGLKRVHREFNAQTIKAGLRFGNEGEHNLFTAVFVAALATKPFVILSGLSGSGKTRLAITFGQWLGRDQVLVQPVRPDWISPEALLGYEDRGSESYDSQYGWRVPRTLEFILKAVRDPSRPYVLILEEMNLAHVERYFADVLSGMESNQPMVPNLMNNATGWRLPSGAEYVPWPKNLFIVGSINVDETTYEFSPKVLDRASVIEFRVSPESLLIDYPETGQIDRADGRILEAFLDRSLGKELAWDGRQKVGVALQKVHRVFYQHAAEFGHRVFRESLRFGAMLNEIGVSDPWLILDLIMVQRVIPKFDTVRGFDQDVLLELAGFAAYGPDAPVPVDPLDAPTRNVVLPRTLEKLRRIAIANAHLQ
jgi:5-methylcytosine-specific restriction enzyme B